jgi:hypothetical protein
MAHCGYEPTAAHASISNPLNTLWTALHGVRTAGPMAPEISLDQQRPAQFVFSRHVDTMLNDIYETKSEARADASRAKQAQPKMPAAAE